MPRERRPILKVRKDSLRWLRMLASQVEPAFAALVEPRGGPETAAVALGVRKLCAGLRVYGGQRIWVFHREGAEGEIEMDTYLNGYDSPQRRARMDRRLSKHSARASGGGRARAPRSLGYVPLDRMVQYSHADKLRAAWRATVQALVVKGAPPFGLIVHLGRGKAAKIEGDIAALTPLMTDTTLLVVARQERKGPEGAFGRFCRDGWGGVVVSGIGLLQRRRDPPMVKE